MKYLVTSALPYVNNIPHLGNLIPVISADIYTRFLRLKEEDVISVLGTDEHGTTTETLALKENKTEQEVVDKYFKIHKEIYEWFNCEYDCLGRTSNKETKETAQEIFLKLKENGYLEEKENEQYYDEKAKRFLSDRFIEGTCPHCKYEEARGDQCDACQKLLNPTDLIKPRSTLSDAVPILKKTKHYYLKLNALQGELEKINKEEWTENAKAVTNAWFKEGLKPRAITRDLKWGIPVPEKGYENKVFYVWFDAPIGYIGITKEKNKKWEEYWTKKDVKLIQFMGKDNIPFHSILFPASIIGSKLKYKTVDVIDANEYINYENTKFSKSRGVGVFGNNAKETGIEADIWRYYLTINRPETSDANFQWEEFQDKNNHELLGNLGNLVNRTLTFIKRNHNGKIFVIKKTVEYEKEVSEIITLYEQRKLKQGLTKIMNLSTKANHYFQEQKPWETIKTNPEKNKNDLTILYNWIKDLAILIQPVMPQKSKEIFEQLNIKEKVTLKLLNKKYENVTIGKPKPLFKKIETIEEYKEKYSGNNNLKKLVLKIGLIEEIKKHPSADKLYIETVNMGNEKKQIVSGLVDHYKEEELIGKKVIIVDNLKPAKLRGELSQGMLLAVAQKDKVGIITVEGEPGEILTFKDVKPANKQIKIEEFSKIKMKAKNKKLTADGKELTKSIKIDKNLEGIVR